MKVTITSENLGDSAHLAGTDVNSIENQLGIRNAPAQLPKKGCSTIRLLDSEVHQIIYENSEPDDNKVRFQFLSYGNRVTISIELPLQPELSETDGEPYLSSPFPGPLPNRNDRF